jgi:hypothetical protein
LVVLVLSLPLSSLLSPVWSGLPFVVASVSLSAVLPVPMLRLSVLSCVSLALLPVCLSLLLVLPAALVSFAGLLLSPSSVLLLRAARLSSGPLVVPSLSRFVLACFVVLWLVLRVVPLRSSSWRLLPPLVLWPSLLALLPALSSCSPFPAASLVLLLLSLVCLVPGCLSAACLVLPPGAGLLLLFSLAFSNPFFYLEAIK